MTGILKCLMLLDSRFSATSCNSPSAHLTHPWPNVLAADDKSQWHLEGLQVASKAKNSDVHRKKSLSIWVQHISMYFSKHIDAKWCQHISMTPNAKSFNHPQNSQLHSIPPSKSIPKPPITPLQRMHQREYDALMIIDDPLFELITAKGQLFLSSLRAFTSQHFVAETARRLMTMRAGRMSSTPELPDWLLKADAGLVPLPRLLVMPRAKQSIAKLGMSQGHTGVQMVSNMSNQGLNTFELKPKTT